MFEFIGRFLSRLWRVSNFWRIPPFEQASAGVRVGSPLGGCLMFLFLLLCIVGALLTIAGLVFGFTFDDVDRWLDGFAPAADFIGTVLIQKVLMAVVLLVCLALAGALVFARGAPDTPSWGRTILILLLCLAVGYCSTVNMLAPLDVRAG